MSENLASVEGREQHYLRRGYWSHEEIGWLSDSAAERWPDREFLICAEQRITYGAFHQWVLAISEDLVAQGVSSGDRVVVQLPNSLEAVALQVAAFRIGAVAVPVVPIYRTKELRHILRITAPTAVATSAHIRDGAAVEEMSQLLDELQLDVKARYLIGRKAPGWSAVPAADSPARGIPLPDPLRSDECALILFTSGTTSEPKGAQLSSRAMLASARMWRVRLNLGAEDCLVACAPVAHLAGFMDAFLIPAAVGARALIMPRWNPDEAVAAIERERGSFSNGAPVFLLDLVERYESGAAPGHRLGFFMAGGAGVSPSLIERAHAVGVKAFRNYGMTETAGSTTLMSMEDPLERRSQWEGRAVEGMELQVVDSERVPVAANTIGDIRLRGPNLMIGYTDRGVNSTQVDDEGWFYPGDVGLLDEDGWLKCVGRSKDIVNRGGEKFSTQEIEGAIDSHGSIARSAVLGLPDPRLGERVVAFVTLRTGKSRPSDQELKEHLESMGLARQKIPVEWVVLQELPTTASGKIRKSELTIPAEGE